MKKLLWIILILIAFFWLLGKCSGGGTTVINDDRTYNLSWRDATDEEFRTISRLMIKKNISGCGDYKIKEIENGEYVIACTDGEKWTYYFAWPNIDEINLASGKLCMI